MTAGGRYTQLEAAHPFVAPRPNRPDELARAQRRCAEAALTQPDPAADLVLLLGALGLRGDK